METNKIHIGSIIKQKVEQNPLSISEFAKRIDHSHGSFYNIYWSAIIKLYIQLYPVIISGNNVNFKSKSMINDKNN